MRIAQGFRHIANAVDGITIELGNFARGEEKAGPSGALG
jgi:hypothetical protein